MSDTKTISVYEKLQNVRLVVQESNLKKGGKNTFARYTYYELPDFLPTSNVAMKQERLTPAFNINEEIATLTIYDWDSEDTIVFETPVADATTLNKNGKPSNLEIQSLGSKHTYLKRYLYMNALELAEHDGLEVNTGNPEYQPKVTPKKQATPTNEPTQLQEKATDIQIEVTKELFAKGRLDKMLEMYKVDKLEDMPKNALHQIIKKEQKAQGK